MVAISDPMVQGFYLPAVSSFDIKDVPAPSGYSWSYCTADPPDAFFGASFDVIYVHIPATIPDLELPWWLDWLPGPRTMRGHFRNGANDMIQKIAYEAMGSGSVGCVFEYDTGGRIGYDIYVLATKGTVQGHFADPSVQGFIVIPVIVQVLLAIGALAVLDQQLCDGCISAAFNNAIVTIGQAGSDLAGAPGQSLGLVLLGGGALLIATAYFLTKAQEGGPGHRVLSPGAVRDARALTTGGIQLAGQATSAAAASRDLGYGTISQTARLARGRV